MEMDGLPHDIIFIIGLFCPLPDVSVFRRISRTWKDALERSAKQRKSFSLTPFPSHGFHSIDSIVASVLKISRQDVLGTSFFHLYQNDGSGTFCESENNLSQFFSSHRQIENLEILWLTEFMIKQLDDKLANLKGLAFHDTGSNQISGSVFENRFQNLEVIAFGSQVETNFVRDSLPHLHKLQKVAFISPADGEENFANDIAFRALSGMSSSVHEVYFGTRKVILDGIIGLQSNPLPWKNITLLELLNPEPNHLGLFLRDILPSFHRLKALSLNLVNTQDAITCPTSKETLSLSASLPDLRWLTLIVDSPLIPYGRVFGQREQLQVLRISGILTGDSSNHMAYFDVEKVREFGSNSPNLRYLCIFPWLLGSELNSVLTMQYVDVIKRLTELRILHLPHTVIDELIIEELSHHLPHLKRIEFVGQPDQVIAERTIRRRSDLKLNFAISYQKGWPFCNCPYSQTNFRLVS